MFFHEQMYLFNSRPQYITKYPTISKPLIKRSKYFLRVGYGILPRMTVIKLLYFRPKPQAKLITLVTSSIYL